MTQPLQMLHDMVCLGCGCLCDDISMSNDGDAIQSIERTCSHGEHWFENQSPKRERGEGGATLAHASGSEHVAKILANARYPILLGLGSLTVEAQREAFGLADDVGAVVDLPSDRQAAMFPGIGNALCTWAEVRDRADVIVYWNCRLEHDHWRHEELVLSRARNRGAEIINIDSTDEVTDAWRLRIALRNRSSDPIASRLSNAKYGVLIHDGSEHTIALRALVCDLNRDTRFRILDLGRPSNSAGATQVAAWQTGFANSVGFHRGYPASIGCEFTAECVLSRGEADVALILGARAKLSDKGEMHLAKIPQIAPLAEIDGNWCSGTVFRSDGVTLPYRAPFSTSFPDAVTVLKSLRETLRRTTFR